MQENLSTKSWSLSGGKTDAVGAYQEGKLMQENLSTKSWSLSGGKTDAGEPLYKELELIRRKN